MRARLERIFGSRFAIPALIAIALALAATSLDTGHVADDWVHQLLVSGHPLAGMTTRPLDLFTFATGDPQKTHALIDQGVFPWWADPTVKLSFFRPISSLTHAVDHALWPGSAALEHAHNLLWFGLALLVVAAVYRRFLQPSWLVGLAVALYALDAAHGPAVGWIANRNAMVALALSLPALALHDRYRRDGWRPGAWLAPSVLFIGLLAGESALATCAYLAAHALCLDRGPLARRLARLWPYALVVVLWRIIYHALGYGAAASGVYLDPLAQPAAFLALLPRRLSALLAAQFALPWSDFTALYSFFSSRLAREMELVTFLVVAAVAWALWPLLRRDRVARFFAVGLLLSALPICATFPADRLLWFVGVGAMGLLAQRIAMPAEGPLLKLAIALFVLLHLVLAPPLLALRSRSMLTVEAPLARAERSLPRGPDLAKKTVVIVRAPADLFAGYLQLTRAARGEPRPAHLRWLTSTPSSVELTRLDARTLELRPDGGFLPHASEQMLRGPEHPLTVGTRIALTGLEIEITSALPDGRPAAARFHFSVPLEDPSLVWLTWQGTAYHAFQPPPVGARVTLPALDFAKALFSP
ncbi:MAG TPA: hypothetical protein VII38_14205 [Polyangia bacterium]